MKTLKSSAGNCRRPVQLRIKYPDDDCLYAIAEAAIMEFDETYPRAGLVQRGECVTAILQDLGLI